MTDCYRILGVSRQASPAEIRAAYLARMKERHPDALRNGKDNLGEGDAGEITFAYWQLRDAARRAEHDRLIFADLAPRPPRIRRANGKIKKRVAKPAVRALARTPVAKPKISARRRARQGRRLQPLRTAAGIAACVVAASAFVVAFTSLQPQGGSSAQAATAMADAGTRKPAAQPVRRRLDPAVTQAAGEAFREVVQNSGAEGAHRYARHCLLELSARPTMTMLDFCLAFDDRAAAWERDSARRPQERNPTVYFAEEQRFGRYNSIARDMRPSPVREAMQADVEFFAAAAP